MKLFLKCTIHLLSKSMEEKNYFYEHPLKNINNNIKAFKLKILNNLKISNSPILSPVEKNISSTRTNIIGFNS